MNIYNEDMIEISAFYNKNINKSIYSYLLSITENDYNRFNDYYTVLMNKKLNDFDVIINNDGIQSYKYNPELNLKPLKLAQTSLYEILNIQNNDKSRLIQIYDNNSYKSIIHNKLFELIYNYLSFIKFNLTPYYNNDKFKDIFLFINIKKQNDLIYSLQSQFKSNESNYKSIQSNLDSYFNHLNYLESQMNSLQSKVNSLQSQIKSLESHLLIYKSLELQINKINKYQYIFYLFYLFYIIYNLCVGMLQYL